MSTAQQDSIQSITTATLPTESETMETGEHSTAGDSLHHAPAFSVQRILSMLPADATPAQQDSAIQANLPPQRQRFLSTRPDTLEIPGLPARTTCPIAPTLLQETRQHSFFAGDPMYHPEVAYPTMGMYADPLPYRLWRDDWVTGLVLLCFIMLVYIYNQTRRFFHQQKSDFFVSPREREGLFAEKTSIETHASTALFLLLSLIGGLVCYGYSQYTWDLSLGQLDPHYLLGIYAGGFLLYFLLKMVLEKFINWVFFDRFQRRAWNESNSYLIFAESILLFPAIVVSVYVHIPPQYVPWIVLSLLLLVKLLQLYKCYSIFFPKMYGALHLIVYFCTLELMPMMALWYFLESITDRLIIKV